MLKSGSLEQDPQLQRPHSLGCLCKVIAHFWEWQLKKYLTVVSFGMNDIASNLSQDAVYLVICTK